MIRHPTTAYTIDVRLQHHMLRQHIRQCTTMFAKKYFLTTEFLSHPKVLHVKLFFKFAALRYENLRLTANNRDKSRQHPINYDFLIRTLSHLKIRMWETSIKVLSHCKLYVRFFKYVKSTMKAGNCLKKWWKSRSHDVYELYERHTKLYEIPRQLMFDNILLCATDYVFYRNWL